MAPTPEELIEHIAGHLGEEHPEALAPLSDASIRRRVAAGIARAHSRGFSEPEPVTAFVTLMFLVAPDFDLHPAIARALERQGTEPDRLRRLFELTAEEAWDQAAASTAGWECLE